MGEVSKLLLRERKERHQLTLEDVQVLVLERVPEFVRRHHSRRGLRSSFPRRHGREIAVFREVELGESKKKISGARSFILGFVRVPSNTCQLRNHKTGLYLSGQV